MRRTAPFVVFLLWVGQARAQDPAAAQHEMIEAAIRHDVATFASYLSEDLTSVDRAGWLRDKAAQLSDLPTADPRRAEDEVIAYGNAIVRVYRVVAGTVDSNLLQVWQRDGERLKALAQQGVSTRNGAVTPATRKSVPLPPSAGPQVDREAITKLIERVNEAARNRDAKVLTASLTRQFVGTGRDGEFVKREEWTRGVIADANETASSKPLAESIRVHGNIAVVNLRLSFSEGRQVWRTIATVKEGGRWLVAAVITTPITGVA